MTWRIFLIASLILVAALSLFARRDNPDELPVLKRAPEPPQPGYFMTDAQIVQTGEDGLPLYRMHANRIQQNPTDLTVALEDLRLTYRIGETTRVRDWTLTARNGLMPQSATGIELQGEVEISGLMPPVGEEPVTLRTPSLSVDLQGNTVHTDAPVDILWGTRGRLKATGLTADLKTERVKLESVSGRLMR